MPTENHIIIDKGTTLHPETNSNQVYDYVRGKWVQEVITDIMNKRPTWDEVQNKPTQFAPSSHTHATSDIRGLDSDLQRLSAAIENVTLPIATTEVLGGIKPDGNTITVNPGTGIASASVKDASTIQKGIVQLNDSLISNSTTQAATANSVKTVNDKLQILLGLNINNQFSEDGSGSNQSYKTGIISCLSLAFTNNNQILQNESVVIGTLAEGFRPRLNPVIGHLYSVFSSTTNLIPIHINPNGTITILGYSKNIPAGTLLTGQICFSV